MLTIQCGCGARGEVPDSAAGKSVRCRQCGGRMTAPEAGASAAPAGGDIYAIEPEAAPVRRAVGPAPAARNIEPAPSLATPTRELIERQLDERRRRSFWLDLPYSFVFVFRPASLGMLVVLLVLGVGVEVAPLGPLGLPIVGLVLSYYMSVVVESAGGGDDLPGPADYDGLWDSVLLPFLQFAGTGLVLALGVSAVGTVLALAGASGQVVWVGSVATAAVAVFIWPICLLGVSIGGLSSLIRLDLLVRSIASAFVPYLAIWVFLGGAVGVSAAVALLAPVGEESGPFANVGPRAALSAASMYVSLVSMRTIGLFYRHFSDRFPWSAG